MKNEFSYRIFREGNDVLLAISDTSLIGKSFEEGELQIDVSKEFYAGSECGKGAVSKLISGATIVNAVGKDIVNLMLRESFVEEDHVLVVDGVPHVQIIKIKGGV